jgi:hypothetical protein
LVPSWGLQSGVQVSLAVSCWYHCCDWRRCFVDHD